MWYRMFNDQILQRIHSRFADFIDERELVIKRIYNQKVTEWENEGNEDIRKGRYTQQSVQKWFDNKVIKLKQWYKECADDILKDIELFNDFFEKVQNYTFSEPDLGTRVIFDFQYNKIYREPYSDPKKFTTSFRTYTYEYGYDMPKSEFIYVYLKFNLPDTSWYTDIIYY